MADRVNRTGITRSDLQAARELFDNLGKPRPRICFRWDNTGKRWEIVEVAPADRTLIAYEDDVAWVEV